ncbi:hypothetical protein SS1G_08190 [Sclerotinia sclerotiorum 1980 UF-70]|uniref:Uncharacterized protein n=1 Tax=Sclerotinia sclerotiorum (strain ATCC 18683 / 1980 / Ss-1) TaxID=665079 RepID=A7ES85_SCLS1|nr:hypothetical protein SS1G_08190 [Sclerotinia sclerotiorum 1980 UF-70]EDN92327.1 hypothetical protein SS1G_08190 [Sclerotinia sclerotiorum 1980 UF-70]
MSDGNKSLIVRIQRKEGKKEDSNGDTRYDHHSFCG